VTHGTKRNRTVTPRGRAGGGEGSLRVVVHDGSVSEVSLDIFEPPRYFEAMLVGRHFSEAPDITARICGICPVAYQLTACAAMEDAARIDVGERVRLLRRLLYCGEWIQSHACTSTCFTPRLSWLSGRGGTSGARSEHHRTRSRAQANGNLIMETVGGRSVHPVNVRVGGFYSAPDPGAIAALAEPSSVPLRPRSPP